ncbi:MAG: cellulase family glycosylhydrolase [Verrucomicrobia bacterium]|nr:cellulase family glycosylhydrolase [Verrucomicrobiota bacterium]
MTATQQTSLRSLALLAALVTTLPVLLAAEALPKIRVAAGGRTFVAETGKPFVPLGVNYYRPGTGWAPQLWKQFDAEATRRDLVKLRELGANCVRVFISFGSFYSKPGALDDEGLKKFDQFLAMAEEVGIYVHPTGPDHWEGLPEWARSDHFANETFLRALEDFWRLFAARYRSRNVIFAYDLKNEPSVGWDSADMRAHWNVWLKQRYTSPADAAKAWGVDAATIQWGEVAVPPKKDAPDSKRLLDYQHFREERADEWTRRQVAAIKTIDPNALVTVGLLQSSVPASSGGVHNAAFRPSRQAKFLDFLEVHFYPNSRGLYDYTKPEDEQRNLAYLESVVREVAAPGKSVVLAEFGWYGGGALRLRNGKMSAPGSEEQQARWCRRAVETTAGLACGWLNWGFYDHPQANDCSQLTGLLTVDGKLKAWGVEFQKLAAQFGGHEVPVAKLGPRPVLDWDRCTTSAKAAQEFREAYLNAFTAGK